MNDQSPKSPLQTWKDLHSVTSLPESEGGPLHSSWLEYQQALSSGQDHHLASRLALPVSLSDLTTSGTLPQHFSGSSESASLNCCLESRLRQQLESTGSILYSLTWKTKATPAGRQYCQRAASVHHTNATDFSSARCNWATPIVNDTTGSTHCYSGKDRKICLKLPGQAKLAAWPSPTANSNDRAAAPENALTMYRKDGSKIQQCLQDFAAITQPIRITDSGQMLTGSDAGMESSGQLRPGHSRWLMGFPVEWDIAAIRALQQPLKKSDSRLEKTSRRALPASEDTAMQSYPSALPNSSPLSEGLLKTCSECAEEKPISEFTFDKRRGSYTSKCTKCRTKKTKEWRDKNPNYEKERYGVNEDRDRWRHIKRKYGISKEEYVEMLDSQGGRCAICGDEPGERYSHQLHVDHCHASGKVRGLLCRGCNHMLGVIKDDEVLLFKAVEYLRKSQRNSLKHS